MRTGQNQQRRTIAIARLIGENDLMPWDPPSQPDWITRDGEILIRWWLKGPTAEVADWTTQRVRSVLDEWLMTTDRQDVTPPQLFVCGCGLIENFADEVRADFACPSVLNAVMAMLDGVQSVPREAVQRMMQLIDQMKAAASVYESDEAMLDVMSVVGGLVLANVPWHESTELMKLLEVIDEGGDFKSSRIRGTAYFTGS